MKTFLKFLIESNKRQKIVLFPGSFKPPTKFHWEGVKEYAKIAKKVYVIISAPISKAKQRLDKNGKIISPEISQKIFNIYKETDHLKNVEILKSEIPNPLRFCFSFIENNLSDSDIILGVSDKDNDSARLKGLQKTIDRIESSNKNIKFLDSFKYITHKSKENIGGATDVRNHIDDFDYLSKNYLPTNLSEKNKQIIFKLLNPEIKNLKEDLNSNRVGLQKIPKLTYKETKKIFGIMKNDLNSSNGFELSLIPKTDGQAVRLAWTSDDVFIESSHSGLISDPDKIFLEPFKEVLKYFQQSKIKNKLISILKNKQNIGIKVFGELLYNKENLRDKDNSITYVGTKYNASKLGNLASIVLFDVKIMDKNEIKEVDDSFKKSVIDFLINKISDKNISFFFNKNFSIPIKIKKTDFTEKNQNNLDKFPNVSNDQLKALRDELNYLLIDFCKKIKKPEIIVSEKTVEGLVFKIGDKEYSVQNPDWITTKESFYKYTNDYNKVLMNFIKTVTGFQQRKKILSIWETNLTTIEKKYKENINKFKQDLNSAYLNFIKNKDKIPTFVYLNNKKFIDLSFERFNKLTNDVSSLKDALTPIKAESLHLNEGGNMFGHGDEKPSRINQENVADTMNDIYEKVLPKLKIKQKNTSVLGSTGKKNPGGTSGDVDLAIDLTNSPYKDEIDFIKHAEKVAKELGIMANSKIALKLCSYRWPIHNTDGKQEGLFVQLDLMPSYNIEMMKWGMYSPHEKDSPYKGLVRNILLNAIASFKDRKILKTFTNEKDKIKPLVWEKYTFSPQTGLARLVKSKEGKKKILKIAKTVSRKIISDNPEQIIKIIFGKNIKPEKLLTIDQVFAEFKKIIKDTETKDKILAQTVNQIQDLPNNVKYPKYLETNISDKSLLN